MIAVPRRSLLERIEQEEREFSNVCNDDDADDGGDAGMIEKEKREKDHVPTPTLSLSLSPARSSNLLLRRMNRTVNTIVCQRHSLGRREREK